MEAVGHFLLLTQFMLIILFLFYVSKTAVDWPFAEKSTPANFKPPNDVAMNIMSEMTCT